MSTPEIIGMIVALLIMMVGLVGCLVPALPGTPLVLLAAVAHKLCFGSQGVGWKVMSVLILLTVISLVLEYLISAYGARRFGATWRGVIGAVLGAVVGLFFGLPGLLLGPFVGAALLELVGRRTLEDSGRAGVGATVGFLAASLAKVACAVIMIGLFSADILFYR